MKKLTALFVLFFLVANISTFAQRTGDKALLFQFSGLSFLGANEFDGGIGGKMFLNNKMAIRGVVKFAMKSETDPWNGVAAGNDGEISASKIGLGAAFEYHLAHDKVCPYFGGGFEFTTSSTERKVKYANGTQQNVIVNRTLGELGIEAGTQLGVFGMLGAEFFIFDNVSLGAEYRLGLSSMARSDEENTAGGVTVKTKLGSKSSFDVSSQGAFTLAIYF